MRPPLDGIVVVTGASSGIGRALAVRLAATARRLVLVARRRELLEGLASELRAAHPRCEVVVATADLADIAAVDALAASLGGVDVLVNNAGLGDLGLFESADPDWLHGMLMVNVVGLTRLTRALLPGMVARGRGGILNVSSGYGLTWMPGSAAYVGTKHYVTAFSESLRCEVRPAGIVVTQLCPGPVATEFVEKAGQFFEKAPPPAWIFLSADRVADAALAGFRRGRAIVIPGLLMKLVVPLGAHTPRFLLRLVYAPMAWALRREARRRLTAPSSTS